MMRKIFGSKSITHLIYGLLMLMPFAAIGVKCAYAVVNKNAYQSYSGQNQTETNYIDNKSNLVIGEEYYFKAGNLNQSGLDGGYEQYIRYELVEVINNSTNIDFSQFDAIGFYASDVVVYYYFNNVGTTFNLDTNFASNQNVEFKFKYLGNTLPNSNNILDKSNNVFEIKLMPNGYIDNVFYYAIDEVIEENNIGLLDFTSWFDGWILSDNAMNNRFIGFANWYMNFAFLVSACYVLFLCMLWFVNFARRLLDRGMNYDF